MMIGLGSSAACGTDAVAHLTSPPNYATIGGPTTFTWTQPDLTCVNWVKLQIGSLPRGTDILDQLVAQWQYGDQANSITVTLPTDGRLLYVSLVSAISFSPLYQEYVYIAGQPAVAPPPPTPSRIPDPTPVVSIAPPPVIAAAPPPTNNAVLPNVGLEVMPVITVGQSGSPVNVPPSASTSSPVPQAPPPTTTITPGAGTSAPPPLSSASSSSGATAISSSAPPADDGTIFGIPKTYALIGAAAVLFLMMGKK